MAPLTTYNFRTVGPARLALLDESLWTWNRALIRSDLTEYEAECLGRFRAAILAEIAATHAEMATCEAAQAKAVAARKPVLTAAAVANPGLVCTRCNGVGRIRGFRHVEGGTCFACKGAGVRSAKRRA